MDIVCFCHLRWDFVYQRPQHLLSRAANDFRVIVIEEPIEGANDSYEYIYTKEGIHRFIPSLENNSTDRIKRLKILVTRIIGFLKVQKFISWYYSPLFYEFTSHLNPEVLIYDCMDELSAFKFASPQLKEMENELISNADIVFTGGHSLYEAKKGLHKNVHCFPSSIDHDHFLKSRSDMQDPPDQAEIPYPRLGYFGVVDERFDIDLLRNVAGKLPQHQFIIIGPVVKIDPEDLPHASNIHYLGPKSYDQLPGYISKWDIALVLFAQNDATRFISPTKTPEYLCAGKPVISTPIADVIHDFAGNPLVRIVSDSHDFLLAVNQLMSTGLVEDFLPQSDVMLSKNSWDITYTKMFAIIEQQKELLKSPKKEKTCLTI